jgi:hypothetical protein
MDLCCTVGYDMSVDEIVPTMIPRYNTMEDDDDAETKERRNQSIKMMSSFVK